MIINCQSCRTVLNGSCWVWKQTLVFLWKLLKNRRNSTILVSEGSLWVFAIKGCIYGLGFNFQRAEVCGLFRVGHRALVFFLYFSCFVIWVSTSNNMRRLDVMTWYCNKRAPGGTMTQVLVPVTPVLVPLFFMTACSLKMKICNLSLIGMDWVVSNDFRFYFSTFLFSAMDSYTYSIGIGVHVSAVTFFQDVKDQKRRLWMSSANRQAYYFHLCIQSYRFHVKEFSWLPDRWTESLRYKVPKS